MIKVLHIFPAYKIGGAPINVLRLIKASNGRIHNFSVGKRVDDSLFQEYVDNTETSYDVDLTNFKLKSLFKLISVMRIEKPNIVHCNGKGGALFGFFIRLLFKVDMYYTFRGFHLKYSGLKLKAYLLFEKVFSKLYNKSISVSHSEQRLFLKYVNVKPKKNVIIPNGVSAGREELPEEIKKVKDSFEYNIVTLSRISHQKDLATILDAMEVFKKENVAMHIMGGHLAGDEEYKESIIEKLEGLESKSRIFFWGDVEGASDLLWHFDVYLSAALFEGLPTAIIEAGLSKVPVLGTDCVGNIDLIQEGVTGFLFPKKDVYTLVKKLRFVLEEMTLQEKKHIVENNLNQMQEFSISNHCEKVLALYQKKGFENITNK
ncbi:MAG: glycosyltransferase family 4 protein [Bacteroidota bacterium]